VRWLLHRTCGQWLDRATEHASRFSRHSGKVALRSDHTYPYRSRVSLLSRLLSVVSLVLSFPSVTHAEPSQLPSPPLHTAFGSRSAKSPIPCNRIDYFTAHFHIADVILLPATDSRGFSATVGYGASMSLFHRLEIGIGGTLSVWSPHSLGIAIQNGPALLNVKGILFPLLRNPVPESEFTFGLQLQQQRSHRYRTIDGNSFPSAVDVTRQGARIRSPARSLTATEPATG